MSVRYVSIKWCALQHGHIVLMALTLTVGVHTRILKLLDLLSVPKESNFHFYRQFSPGRTPSPGIIKWADRALPPSAADFLQPLLNKVHFCTECNFRPCQRLGHLSCRGTPVHNKPYFPLHRIIKLCAAFQST